VPVACPILSAILFLALVLIDAKLHAGCVLRSIFANVERADSKAWRFSHDAAQHRGRTNNHGRTTLQLIMNPRRRKKKTLKVRRCCVAATCRGEKKSCMNKQKQRGGT